jgi:hypothetical protein
LTKQIHVLQASENKLMQNVIDLEMSVAKSSKEKKALQTQLDALRVQNEQQQQQIQMQQQAGSSNSEASANTALQVQQLTQSLKEFVSKDEALQVALAEERQRHQDTLLLKDSYERDVARLSGQLESANKLYTQYQLEAVTANEKQDVLSNQVEQLLGSISDLQRNESVLKAMHVQQLNEAQNMLKVKETTLKNEIDQLRSQVSALFDNINALTAKNQLLESQQDTSTADRVQLAEEYKALTIALNKANEEQHKLEMQLSASQADNQSQAVLSAEKDRFILQLQQQRQSEENDHKEVIQSLEQGMLEYEQTIGMFYHDHECAFETFY